MKNRRQKKIVEIIGRAAIRTQGELAKALKWEGFDVTQATVSRDIKELRLVKLARGDNNYAYSMPKGQLPAQDESRLRRIFREAVLQVDSSDNIVVIHTLPGNANSVCSLLDSANWEEFLGAVAGDDTILVVAKTREHVAGLLQKMQSLTE
ncbi:MAG: arginine repressor [Peptococcaceae bacterium]|jgi:transcriptional regulator of arginine metabolism|nr:arginine repressor [Peptococcaceae bacterium]